MVNYRNLAIYTLVLSVQGVLTGFTLPLIALRMDVAHYSHTAIGIMTSTPALGLLLLAVIAPKFIHRVSARRFMNLTLICSAICSLLLPVFESWSAWLVLRFLYGFCQWFYFPYERVLPQHQRHRTDAG